MFPVCGFTVEIVQREKSAVLTSQKPWQLKIPEMSAVAWNGSGIFSVCQYAGGNSAVGFEFQEYQETQTLIEGKQMWFLIFWMGIIAPLAEEIVFRWLIYLRLRDYMRMGAAAVISGLIFGIYHGNLLQAVYASLLGIVLHIFWISVDICGASVLLHMGANIWSLISA